MTHLRRVAYWLHDNLDYLVISIYVFAGGFYLFLIAAVVYAVHKVING